MATGRKATVDQHPLLAKKPTPIHEGLAEFILNETGHKVSAKSVQLTLLMNGQYHESDEYADATASIEDTREAAKQAKVDARNARIKARRDKLQAAIDALEDTDEEDEQPARSRRVSKKAAPARRAAKAAPARRGRPARATEEDDETPAPARKRGRPRKAAAPTESRGNLRAVEAASDDDGETEPY